MVRAVFDTVVFVRCLINRRGLWGRIVFDRAERYQLVVSKPTVRETLEVLSRPEIAAKFRRVTEVDRQAVIAALANATVVEVGAIPAISRDPKDDPFLATARAARADFLVTEDKDLLVLGEYEGTKIVPAATFLAVLEASEDDNNPPPLEPPDPS